MEFTLVIISFIVMVIIFIINAWYTYKSPPYRVTCFDMALCGLQLLSIVIFILCLVNAYKPGEESIKDKTRYIQIENRSYKVEEILINDEYVLVTHNKIK